LRITLTARFVGYLNIYSWYDGEGWLTIKPGSEFANAIKAFMADESIEGIIIDSRLNEGGTPGI
jgi:C-terminal processing protease CtpA/Prc